MSDGIFLCFFFFTLCCSVIFRSELHFQFTHMISCIVVLVEPLAVMSSWPFCRLLVGQHVFTPRGYSTTPWFGMCLASFDSLHMRLHVDEIIFKFLHRCACELFFHWGQFVFFLNYHGSCGQGQNSVAFSA